MKRRLLNVLTGLSLLAAAAVAAAWGRGHVTGDVFRHVTGGTSRADQTMWVFASGGGGVALATIRGWSIDVNSLGDGEPLGFHWRTTTPRYATNWWPGDNRFNRAGFYWLNMPGDGYAGRMGIYGVVAPAWSLFLLTAALPAGRGAARLLRRRHVPGTCRR